MPRTTDTRLRTLRTAARLLRRQGFAATGWRQVVAESATPWGSQAHHFPGGKEQLAAEEVALAGVCGTALASWRAALTEAIVARGVATRDAERLATLVLAGIEGGLLLARAGRNPEPLHTIGDELAAVIRTRVP